jgi:nitrate/nitrite transporter NarK
MALIVLVALHAQKHDEVRWHLAFSLLAAALSIAVVALIGASNHAFSIVGLVIASVGGAGAISLFWQFPGRYLSGQAAAFGFAAISSLGNLAGFVAPTLIGAVKNATGSYQSSFLVVAAVEFLAFALVAALLRDPSSRSAVPRP